MDADLTDAKRLFASAYDATAKGYSSHADRFVYRHLALPLVHVIGDAVPVLDVASGSGALGRQCREAIAVDLSAGQLATNPLRNRVRADAERLPFRDGVFAAAACAFGINHYPDPAGAVREMARVARRVAVLTWARPDDPYTPKQVVLDVVRHHAGVSRAEAGLVADEMTEAVGSPDAVAAILEAAGLRATVRTVEVEVPWPGAAAFVDYRLSTISVVGLDRLDRVRADAVAALSAVASEELRWRPRLVLGVGER